MNTLRLGDTAPDFEQDSSMGRIRLYDYLGDSWGVLFSHPADFTPVCTTELGYTAIVSGEFAKRNVKVLAVSVDDVDSHHRWIDDINDTQNTTVNFPILADADRKVRSEEHTSELQSRGHLVAHSSPTRRSSDLIRRTLRRYARPNLGTPPSFPASSRSAT